MAAWLPDAARESGYEVGDWASPEHGDSPRRAAHTRSGVLSPHAPGRNLLVGLDLLEVGLLEPNTNHRNQVKAAHHDDH